MRKTTVALLTTALTMLLALPALAGGWAVTSFTNLPESFEANTTYTLEYTVLQHGQTPADSGASHVMFRNFDADTSLRFDAVNHGDGTYSVEVTLPVEGSWEWSVSSEIWGTQDLGTIEVAGPSAVAAGTSAVEVLRVALPLATVAAGAYTLSQFIRDRRTTATDPA